MVRWSETTRNYVGPPEHSIQWSCGPPKYLALAYRLLAVRLTCIACFLPISQSTLNWFLWDFERPIVGHPPNTAQFSFPSINPLNWLDWSLKIALGLHARWSNFWKFYRIFFYGNNLTVFGGWLEQSDWVLAQSAKNMRYTLIWRRVPYNQNRNMPRRYKQSSQLAGDNARNTVSFLIFLKEQNTFS